MRENAVNIENLPKEKLEELFDVLEAVGEDVTRENGIAFPHETQPLVELGWDPENISWIMAPRGYFHGKTFLSADEFIKTVDLPEISAETIMGMSEDGLRDMLTLWPFDRLGSGENGFVMALYPTKEDDVEMVMWVPVDASVVREFYIRQLCSEVHNENFSH